MKKLLLLSATILFSFLTSNAQDTWTSSEQAGFGNASTEYIYSMVPFKGSLYAASGNYGAGIWSSPSGTAGTWTNAATSPFFNSSYLALATTTEGGGYIYSSLYASGSDSARIFKSFDGITWAPYYTAYSELAHIVPFKGTGSVDSIYVVENDYMGARIWRSGYSTNDPSNLLGSWQNLFNFDTVSAYAKISSTLVSGGKMYFGTTNGAQLWSTSNGTAWIRNDSIDFGFGDANNSDISALAAFGGYIYAGTTNYYGAQLWRSADELNWSLVRTYSGNAITDLEIASGQLWISVQSGSSTPALVERTMDGSAFIVSANDGFGGAGNYGDKGNMTVFGNNLYYSCRNYFSGGAIVNPGTTNVRTGGGGTGVQIQRTCLATPPTLNLGSDLTLCESQTTILDAGAAIAYLWNTGATTQTITASAGIGTTLVYSCQITAANGCDAIDFVNFYSTPAPSISVINPYMGLPSYLCKGNSVSMLNTATSGLYIISPPFIKTTNVPIDDLLGDRFDTLAVSAVSGSTAGISLISVTIDSLEHTYAADVIIGLFAPDGSYIDLSLNHGGSSNLGYYGTELIMGATNNLFSSSPPFTGQFQPDNGFYSLTGSPNGNWVMKVGDIAGGDNGYLKGWTLKFGYADTIMTYSWTPSGGLTSINTLNTIATPSSTTSYALTVTNQTGCATTKTIQLIVPEIIISPSSATVCYGSSTTLSATGGITNYWSPATYLSATTGADVITTASTSIMYYVMDTVASCPIIDSVYVTANPQLFVTASLPQAICASTFATLTANGSGGTPAYTYTWNDGGVNTSGQTISVSPLGGTSYTLVATDANGCNAYDNTSVSIIPSTGLFGKVTYSGGNVTNGNVIIYNNLPGYSYLDTVQSTALDLNGEYLFPVLTSGNYLIKVFADNTAYPTLNSTYYGNTFNWATADSLLHGCSSTDTANIVMVEELGTTSGPGNLRGRITEDLGFGSFLSPGIGPRTPGDPIPGLDVKLGKNPGGAMVTSTSTSDQAAPDGGGFYYFSNIPLNVGTEQYVVYVDIPGLGIDSSYTFAVNAATSQYLYLDYVVDSTTIHFVPNAGVGISNATVATENKFKVYPNPFKGNASIEYSIAEDADVVLEVYNVLGSKISTLANGKQTAGNHQYNLNDLRAGVYFVTLTVNDNVATQRVIVME
ncbi:MAG TPA: T9SS type A sorting domain-containing protein [Bacteroidia bacterium]|jgi:subtilisin-like proprotein convertase family protein